MDPARNDQRRDDPALVIRDLSKTFGPTVALSEVGLEVGQGSVHGLLGGNGSGKSTLIKILAGVHRGEPGGSIEAHGELVPCEDLDPSRARELGLRFVHQNPAVFRELSVAENMALGSGYPTRMGSVRWRSLKDHCAETLERLEIDVSPSAKLGTLRPADQTMIAIARALQDVKPGDSSILVLDEPTASLPEHEVEVLLESIRKYASQGHSVLYVSHRLDEVLSIVDCFTVLRDSRHVTTRTAAGISKDQLVLEMFGRPVENVFQKGETAEPGKESLAVRDLTGGPIRGADLTIHDGEIVGIAGLLGSGRTELLQMIFGALSRESGKLSLHGRSIQPNSPSEAMKLGIGYVPEDRAAEALFEGRTVRDNVVIGAGRSSWKWGRFDRKSERSDTFRGMEALSVKADGVDSSVSSLSGGNQQKIVLARWLLRDPSVLLLDEPTQGVDINARHDAYVAIRQLVERGGSVLLVSSDFEELAFACDRCLVLRGGRICEEVSGSELNPDRLNELVHGPIENKTTVHRPMETE